MAFRGKVALITGGGSGMGQLAVKRLADQGALVAAIDVNDKGLEETAKHNPDKIKVWNCDVSNEKRVFEVVADIEKQLGPIDRAVTAAAIMPSGLLMEQEIAVMRKMMDINYGGVVNVTRATMPGMLKRDKGDQIIFASLLGWLPTMHFGAYCASKFAVRAYADVLRHENIQSKIRFACVCPPMVQTPLLTQVTTDPKVMKEGKPMQPNEVLDAIEMTLEKDKFWVLPGQARFAQIASRLIPDLIWKNMHKIEGI